MKPRTPTRHHRHLLELASLLATAGLADTFSDLFGKLSHGADMLIAIGLALLASTVGHHMWLRRSDHAPPAASPTPSPNSPNSPPADLPAPGDSAGSGSSGAFWRVRTHIDNTPGRLAVLAGALAAAGANIHALEAHPVPDGVVDEFLVEASQSTTAEHLCGALRAVGGRAVRALPADARPGSRFAARTSGTG